MKLSAVMIVKNEAQVIDRCLSTLRGFDEVIVCDTGSQDDTVVRASAYGNVKVFTDFPWSDDFSAARNHALSKATGDWCMQIDADHELVSTTEEVRKSIRDLERNRMSVGSIQLQHAPSKHSHYGAWLFRRSPDIFWVGAVHECLNKSSQCQTNIRQEYRKSPSHDLDPDRNLRILQKNQNTPRDKFYLGRELFERGRYDQSIIALKEYLEVATWLPEICEAHLTLARCHWSTGFGDAARSAAFEAVKNNPMFKEALLFLGEIHYEPWKSRWIKLAEAADNEGVLFVRVERS